MPEPWTCPEWMRRYAPCFTMIEDPTVAEIERHMNMPDKLETAVAVKVVTVAAQVALLKRLMLDGLLLIENPEAPPKPKAKRVKPAKKKRRRR